MGISLLIDCETSAILDKHCSMKQPHDTQVGLQVLMWNLYKLTAVIAEKRYDLEILCQKLRAEGVKPLITTREEDLMEQAKYLLFDKRTLHIRPNAE